MLAFARWFVTVVGGVVLGVGVTLHGQVAFARHLRSQVDGTFFLWRAIGNATFALQSDDVRLALAMSEVPEQALAESDRAAWMLVTVGGLVAATGALLRRGGAMPPRARRP